MSTPPAEVAAPPAPTPTPPAVPAAPPAPPTADEPLGDGGKKALDAEREARRQADKALADLRKEIEDSKKTAEQKASDALNAAQRTADENAARALRYEVAAAKGLDLSLAARLSGTTKEELEADADSLMALIPKAPTPPAPPAGPVVPGEQTGAAAGGAALVTQADLDALGAAGKYDEINKLRREGRLEHLGVAPPKRRCPCP
jgi:ElaB/YqjD/DUF883 family membrane-anchored ribosome-binding protein